MVDRVARWLVPAVDFHSMPQAAEVATAVTHPASAVEPVEPHQFNQGFTLQGASIILGLIIATMTIIGTFRKWRRESEQDARSRTDELKAEFRLHDESVEKRMTTMETTIKDFMPRAEIEGKIDHEKANRVTVDESLRLRLDRHDSSITDIKVEIGRIGEKHGSLAATMEEVKALVKEQGRDMGARLDKISDAISGHRST